MNLTENSDAAKRISDTVALHLTVAIQQGDIAGAIGKWCVFALQDGTTDNNLYDTKQEAIDHQSIPKNHCYLKITPDGITPKDAWHFLKVNRHPMIDTTAPEHKINPALYPRFSNLSRAQKRALIKEEEKRRNASER